MAVTAAAVLSGCATPHSTESKGLTSFLTYEGQQQRWPRAESTLVRADFAVPAYQGLPQKAYQIIGLVVPADAPIVGQSVPGWLWNNETRLANACNQAKGHGADAIAVTSDPVILKALRVQTVGPAKSSRVFSDSDAVIIAIKWVPSAW